MDRLSERITSLDWERIAESLDRAGYAATGPLLEPHECAGLTGLYDIEHQFRKRIEMERFRYGVGEYKYFAAPLPRLVERLRTLLYGHLTPIANRWMQALGAQLRYPETLSAFLELCRIHDQIRPTPLLLRYETGGYNCMHQDLYGEIAFPLQFTCVLSRRNDDYEGGEFLLMEQRPRSQSRVEAITLEQGEGIIFATRFRPAPGTRGFHRLTLRHGVSRLRAGRRYSLGIIFHDAK